MSELAAASRKQPMASLAVGTIADRRYLPWVRVLARSLIRHHPELALWFLVANEEENGGERAEARLR